MTPKIFLSDFAIFMLCPEGPVVLKKGIVLSQRMCSMVWEAKNSTNKPIKILTMMMMKEERLGSEQ